jgi:hypothetical protein
MNNSLPVAFARLLKSLVTWLVCISAYGGKFKRSGYTNHIGGRGVPASKCVRTEWELGLYHNHSLSCFLDRGNEMRFYELKNGRVFSFGVLCDLSKRTIPLTEEYAFPTTSETIHAVRHLFLFGQSNMSSFSFLCISFTFMINTGSLRFVCVLS